MLEMLKARKEALQERGVKGFTLMEMLIVIAIIAVLIAIAIPVFTGQINGAQDAADEANARSIYALVQSDVVSPAKTGTGAVDTAVAFDSTAGAKKATVTLSDSTTQEFNFSDRTTNVQYGKNATTNQVAIKLTYGGGTQTFGDSAVTF